MPTAYEVFVNGLWFDHLQAPDQINDKLVFFRHHEKSLWTLFQVLQAGGHRVSLTDAARQVVVEFTAGPAFAAWVAAQYPGMAAQLGQPAYTRSPHPQDALPSPGEPGR